MTKRISSFSARAIISTPSPVLTGRRPTGLSFDATSPRLPAETRVWLGPVPCSACGVYVEYIATPSGTYWADLGVLHQHNCRIVLEPPVVPVPNGTPLHTLVEAWKERYG